MVALVNDSRSARGRRPRAFSPQALFLAQVLFLMFALLLGTRISDLLLDAVTGTIPYEHLQAADSLFQFVVAGATILWGVLVDRFPVTRKHALAGTTALGSLVSVLFSLLPTSIAGLYLTEVCWGFAVGAMGPIVASFLGDLFKVEKRGRLFSVFTVFLYIIKGSAIAVTGIIGDLSGNWKVPNLLFGLLGLGGAVVFFLTARAPALADGEPEIAPSSNEEPAAYGQRYQIRGADLKTIILKPTNALFLLQGLTGMFGVTIVTRYMNYWFTSSDWDGMGMDPTIAVLLLGFAGAVGALVGIVSAGAFIDRNFRAGKPQRALVFATLCVFLQVGVYAIILHGLDFPTSAELGSAGGSLPALLERPVFLQFVVWFNVAVFFSTPVGTSVSTARTHANLPEHRGTAAALFDTTDFIGAGIGLLLGSLLLETTGSYPAVIQVGTLFWLVSGVIWIGLTRAFGRDYLAVRETMHQRAQVLARGGGTGGNVGGAEKETGQENEHVTTNESGNESRTAQ